MDPRKVVNFVRSAFECSVYLQPKDPGLTRDEVLEAGRRADLMPGELGDALQQLQCFPTDTKKLLPHDRHTWGMLIVSQDPEYRNFEAFDFVMLALRESIRSEGIKNARLEPSGLVERGVAQGFHALDVEVAIALLQMSQILTADNEGYVRFRQGKEQYALFRDQHRPLGGPTRNEARARAYPIVKDIIARRTDSRLPAAEPLDAFAHALDVLGYSPFRLWWTQMVSELRLSNTASAPTSGVVLAAALVEGALTFVVRHARSLKLGAFGSDDFAKDPRTWSINALITSAARGQEHAVLDPATRQRAEMLVQARQRIHAGRMLHDFPQGAPDLRPEEARDARMTAELVVRRVLDWLEKHPPPK